MTHLSNYPADEPRDCFGNTFFPGDKVARPVRVWRAAYLAFRTVVKIEDGVVYTKSDYNSREYALKHPEMLVIDLSGRAGR